jgi:hypothetical protein
VPAVAITHDDFDGGLVRRVRDLDEARQLTHASERAGDDVSDRLVIDVRLQEPRDRVGSARVLLEYDRAVAPHDERGDVKAERPAAALVQDQHRVALRASGSSEVSVGPAFRQSVVGRRRGVILERLVARRGSTRDRQACDARRDPGPHG